MLKNITTSIKLIIFVIMIFPLSGCVNKYYLQKKVDVFNPKINDKFTVNPNTSIDFYESIFSKLVNEFSKIPMIYSTQPYIPYAVYFDNFKRFFGLPVFRVTVVKQNNTFSLPDEIVYDSFVYSYRFNVEKSLVASLSIIASDIVNKSYKKSRYIKFSKMDIENSLKEKVKKIDLSKGDIKNYKSDKKEYTKYRLYNNLELYKK